MTERTARLLLALLVIGATTLPGCAWNRSLVNERMSELPFDSVEPGRTTLQEVLLRFGLPPEDDAATIGTRSTSSEHVVYTTLDQRCTRVGLAAFFVVTPFRWCAAVRTHEVSIEFDANGVVERVITTRRQGFWPPFQNERDVPAAETTVRSVGGST